MENLFLIQVTNQKAFRLIHELEELNLIKVLKENVTLPKTKLSEKYRGILSKKESENLQEHIIKMRGEWNNI